MQEEIVFRDYETEILTLTNTIQNNALLRVVLYNQIKIMEGLGLDSSFPLLAFNDTLSVVDHEDINTVYEKYLKQIKVMSSFLEDRNWEHAQLKISKREPDEERKEE